jgi:PBSX family phage terminase large subunit
MELTQTQRIIAEDTHRFRVVNCGRRFGKTILAIEEMIGLALARKARIAYIAPTYQQSRDIAWEQLKKRIKDIALDINESRLEVKIPNMESTESIIVLRGWESIETLRGQSFDLLILDEVAMMRYFWERWQEVLRPTLTDRKGQAMFISTPKGFNHFYELYNEEAKDKHFKSFHFTSYDNPHIPKEEVDEARNQLTEDRFAQEYLGDFRKQEGLVYKEFQRHRHIYKEIEIDVAERLAGIDFGYTNPTAILDISRDRNDVYWVTGELYRTGMTHEQVAEYVSSQKYNKVYADPASPEAIKVLRDKNVNVYDVVKGRDSIISGIDKIRELLKQGRLRIHESCENLIWELETYAYPSKKDLRNEDELPIKENDHSLDALRYCLMTNQPEKVMRPGEMIRILQKRRANSQNRAL